MASNDTDDDIIISSALLVASTLYQRRQVNIRKYKRNSWARKQINWPITARRQSEKSPKNRDGSSNLVAQLVKSWTTYDVKRATLLSNKVVWQSCSTLLRVWHHAEGFRYINCYGKWDADLQSFGAVAWWLRRQLDIVFIDAGWRLWWCPYCSHTIQPSTIMLCSHYIITFISLNDG